MMSSIFSSSHRLRIVLTVFFTVFTIVATTQPSMGTMVPFEEDFATDASNWRDIDSADSLAWVANGGPDGGSYASTTFSFENSTDIDTPPLFRAHDEFNSSGNAFVGDWVSDGVTGYSYWVRHNATESMNFFTRYASPSNFPGAASVNWVPVAPNTWTEITVPIPDPNFVFEGPFTFNQVFSNIGHLQIGVTVPENLAGNSETFTFDLDKVSIVPEPTTGALALMGALSCFTRRRRLDKTS